MPWLWMGGLFLSETFPSANPRAPPADYLYNQTIFPNSIISAPAGEVQGSWAMKRAVLHFPNVLCLIREDVFSFALHPVRTKGGH